MAAAPPVASFFLLLGAAVLVGYVGQLLFHRYRFSDVLLLLGAGAVLGPYLDLVEPGTLDSLFVVLAPFGLMLVLFEGGAELTWHDLRRVGPRAVAVTLGTWLLTAAALTVTAHYALGFPPHLALVLGTALAGPGVTTLLPLLPKLGLPGDVRAFVAIELTLGSLLNAVTTTAVVAVIMAGATPAGGFGMVGAGFVVGGAVGVLVGVGWARTLHLLRGEGPVLAATLGVLVAAFVFTEAIGGSGYLMALVVGLVVGNAGALARDGGVRALATLDPEVRRTGSELVFMFRSLYFVYLGVTVWSRIGSPRYALGALLLMAVVLAIRYATMATMRAAGPAQRPATTVLYATLVPRGLSTAIVASVPAAMGMPGAGEILPYVFFVIVLANVVAMAGLWAYDRLAAPKGSGAPAVDAVPR